MKRVTTWAAAVAIVGHFGCGTESATERSASTGAALDAMPCDALTLNDDVKNGDPCDDNRTAARWVRKSDGTIFACYDSGGELVWGNWGRKCVAETAGDAEPELPEGESSDDGVPAEEEDVTEGEGMQDGDGEGEPPAPAACEDGCTELPNGGVTITLCTSNGAAETITRPPPEGGGKLHCFR